MQDRCVCCGECVPEERQVCKNCETGRIKDSGNRTKFPTGAVRDIQEGKGRYDLLPWDAIHELALHCEQGAKKYGERNCEKGIPIHSLIDSAIRHLSCYLRGMDDEPHLRAAMWNIAFAIWIEKKKPEMQLELQGELKSLMNQLKELGVNNLEEAEEMIHQMEKDLEKMRESIEEQIEQIEELMEGGEEDD